MERITISNPAIPASRPYRCHRCGAASYGRVIERGADGAMAAAGGFRCSGCAAVFAALSEWRGAPAGDGRASARG